METAQQWIQNNYPEVAKLCTNERMTQIPDLRLFESDWAKQQLPKWNDETIWEELAKDLSNLSQSPEETDCRLLDHMVQQRFAWKAWKADVLTRWCISYPTLSFLLSLVSHNVQAAVMGNHPNIASLVKLFTPLQRLMLGRQVNRPTTLNTLWDGIMDDTEVVKMLKVVDVVENEFQAQYLAEKGLPFLNELNHCLRYKIGWRVIELVPKQLDPTEIAIRALYLLNHDDLKRLLALPSVHLQHVWWRLLDSNERLTPELVRLVASVRHPKSLFPQREGDIGAYIFQSFAGSIDFLRVFEEVGFNINQKIQVKRGPTWDTPLDYCIACDNLTTFLYLLPRYDAHPVSLLYKVAKGNPRDHWMEDDDEPDTQILDHLLSQNQYNQEQLLHALIIANDPERHVIAKKLGLAEDKTEYPPIGLRHN